MDNLSNDRTETTIIRYGVTKHTTNRGIIHTLITVLQTRLTSCFSIWSNFIQILIVVSQKSVFNNRAHTLWPLDGLVNPYSRAVRVRPTLIWCRDLCSIDILKYDVIDFFAWSSDFVGSQYLITVTSRRGLDVELVGMMKWCWIGIWTMMMMISVVRILFYFETG